MNDIDRKIAELKQHDKNYKEWEKNGFVKDIPKQIHIGIISHGGVKTTLSDFIKNMCPYCMGSGKLKAMQNAMTYEGYSVRVDDSTVKCNNCDGTGIVRKD